MLRLQFILLFILLLPAPECFSQETDPGPGYQIIMMNNPALSGSEGDGTLRMSYLNYLPGNGYNLHSFYLSFDSYFQALHGGASFYLAEDYLGGDVNNIRGGLAYSYFLQAGEDLFLTAGLTGSVYHRGFNFRNPVLPDMIDPLGGVTLSSSEVLKASGRTVFDLGTGFTFMSKYFSGGLAIQHLAEPDMSLPGMQKEEIKRKLFFHLLGDLPLGKSQKVYARPLAFFSSQDDFFLTGAGLSVENEYLAANAMTMADNAGSVNIQTGFSFKTGIVRFIYSYRFNIVSGNSLMPMSLLHHTGLAFSLYHVDKRKTVKTINFPKM